MTIKTVTIDSLALAKCDFIKLDVEGCELKALHGAEQTISRFHPKMVIEINHGALERQNASAEKLYAWLRAKGYKWRELVPSDGGNAPQTDILCLPLEVESKPDTTGKHPLWADYPAAVAKVTAIAAQLREYCTAPRYTSQVRELLVDGGVVAQWKTYRKRRKGK